MKKNKKQTEMTREPNTQYVLSLSYGKDSLACLEAIRILGLPLDRIVHAELWATDTISADLPPMVEFKKKADEIILKRYGIVVEHICAVEREREKPLSFEGQFYTIRWNKKLGGECIYGFPMVRGLWCNSKLKLAALRRIEESSRPFEQGAKINTVQYLGIAVDEPERIARHTKSGVVLPLVLAGWDEAFCRQLCKELDLLSPIYTDSARGGCWFCHNQSIDQLRLLRRNYPELWALLLEWDKDSPVSFHPDGHTVHHFDLRFQAENEGRVPTDRKFRWKMLNL